MRELHFAGMRALDFACVRGKNQLPVRELLRTWGARHVANVRNGHFLAHPSERALKVV
jgi:hypothetical protein